MVVKNPKFVISAVCPAQYPDSELLEIAFAGRSNVGKSSLINALVGRKRLAYSGSTQGMTRQINFYNLDDEIHFVDLPGYGYASVSKDQKSLWAGVIDKYLNVRPQLYMVILLLDIRHNPTEDDKNMYRWIQASGLQYAIVATKADKLSKMQVAGRLKEIRACLNIANSDTMIYPVSSEKKTGIDRLWAAIDEVIMEDSEA